MIGGQAVNYWAEHYLADEPGVTAGAVESLAIGAEWSGRHIRVLDPISLLLCKVKLALTVSQEKRHAISISEMPRLFARAVAVMTIFQLAFPGRVNYCQVCI